MEENVLSIGRGFLCTFVKSARQFGRNLFCAVEAAQPHAVCAVHSSLCRDTNQGCSDNARAQFKAQTGPDRLIYAFGRSAENLKKFRSYEKLWDRRRRRNVREKLDAVISHIGNEDQMLMAKLIAVYTDLEKKNWDPAGKFLESKRNAELKEIQNSPICQAEKKRSRQDIEPEDDLVGLFQCAFQTVKYDNLTIESSPPRHWIHIRLTSASSDSNTHMGLPQIGETPVHLEMLEPMWLTLPKVASAILMAQEENNPGIAEPSKKPVTSHSMTAEGGMVCSGPWDRKDRQEKLLGTRRPDLSWKEPRMLNMIIARKGESWK
ncbi:hypothetical protein K438DRAFT_1774756 [Mycena galopus ATCC 62051]|nr:hypothetical protein K438DRAFT_1774756 [Mycena galopus ATCC 62051]